MGAAMINIFVPFLALVSIYLSLGLFFSSEESGYSWLYGFVGLSGLVLFAFALLLSLAAKRHQRSREDGE